MIGSMARRFFSESPMLGFAVIALAIFVVVFLIILFRVARTNDDDVSAMALLPLQEGTEGDDA